MVALQAARNLAQQVDGQFAGNRRTRGATAVEDVGASRQGAVANHLANQADPFAGLLLHLCGNVVFVEIDGLVGQSVQDGVLLQGDRHVDRGQRFRSRVTPSAVRCAEAIAAVRSTVVLLAKKRSCGSMPPETAPLVPP